ncbi:MAG: pyridoxamine 5'-phosphate oxidase family protein [Candidatus Micrarchaeota archaeon]|nr:pyridoxamine 5'-phosphate oxidase family protein [Candidatus Micrarchaeota archaeon]MDE1833773.1 pyridoxamine 5'-phosphate oxidase family protein [Candidatus Micrarchaeota archaeon]MDE1858939.1 pyridoxamine 5'-phosphate oxidase family protein [Candidatus Micrarchaeota archaeon]
MVRQVGTYEEKAKYIINHNTYMVVATCGKDLKPWVAPVAYAHDSEYNFYFISAIDSRHAKHIEENPNSALAIFSSEEPIGETDGVQIEVKITQLKKGDLNRAIELYCKRLFPQSKGDAAKLYKPEQYIEPSEFRFFKAEVVKMYVTGEDRRVAVDFKSSD